ncbi:MAG: undecaprenyl/decaprenyl-phosphate alpha-N-acetylglucosaminyl 1-phosphate transferase [Erysipelotrichaceae bacterium]|jgi:UDP-GlcNAc:undecaprenyl-phosphate GlcNAc-1-phosphate transferase|nr:undecaprenyl/decaprenyl-phosphate alpha-N-acetylglucosaminyl 1-phosphate transferase [Erysipelotrichaceae bacterium]
MSQLVLFLKANLLHFVSAALIAVVLVPVLNKTGIALGIYARQNNRTIHTGKVVRIGGASIYLAFLISMCIFLKADRTINGILLGGLIIFIVGLVDDIYDLKPMVKLAGQIAAALVAMFVGGVGLETLNLPFHITLRFGALNYLITFFWILGIANAINLIDGLDGLAAGISAIVLATIGFLAVAMGSTSVGTMAMLLCGATIGFLIFNFHPARIFMGDCGALYLGYNIACFSLLGFKTATFITLALPIIVLSVPILDTLIAIVRRRLKGVSFSQGDKEHMHHILMYRLKLGHVKAVLVLYLVTALFAATALVSYYHERWGLALLLVLIFGFELFVEATDMVNVRYHPLMGLSRRLFGVPKKRQ